MSSVMTGWTSTAPSSSREPDPVAPGQPRRPRPGEDECSGREGDAEEGEEERARTPRLGGSEEQEREPERGEVADEVAVAQRAAGGPFRGEEGRPKAVGLGERRDGGDGGGQREGVEERSA